MTKDDIRRQVRARKALVDRNEGLEAARRVFGRVRSMAPFIMARNILLYHSLPDELPTIEFLRQQMPDKTYCLPRVNGIDLEILPYSRTRMHLGAFRIEEPDGDDTVDIADIDLVIVPAVAYDRSGNRIGRGKGYYDRLLSRSRATTIGICYDFQLFDSFDAEEHDIPVDYVVADRHPLVRKKKR